MEKENNKPEMIESNKNAPYANLDRLSSIEYRKEVGNEVRNELQKFRSDQIGERLQVFADYLHPSCSYFYKLKRHELKKKIDENLDFNKTERRLLLDLENELNNYLNQQYFEANDSFLLVKSDEVVSSIDLEEQRLDEMIVQNKEIVLNKITDLSDRTKVDYLNLSRKEVASLSNDEKAKFLKCFTGQNENSDLNLLVEYYTDKYEFSKASVNDGDDFVYALSVKMKNFATVSTSLKSVLHGSLGSTVGPRTTIDAEKNLDLDFSEVSAKNEKLWHGSKEFIEEKLKDFKDAPMAVKGVIVMSLAFVTMTAYKVMNTKNSDGSEPVLSKAIRYSLYAIGGYAGLNLLSDINEREAPKDYEKLNQVIREQDFAEFFTGKEATEQQEEYAGEFIESLYEPRFNNMEFAEIMSKHENNLADSSDWLKYTNGKNLDPVNLHGAIGMIKERYNPENGIVYADKSIPNEVKEDMRGLWEIAIVDKPGSSEYSYKDVVMSFLALDPKFTFRNERYAGNLKEEIAEYVERQNKIQELERIQFFDPVTAWTLDTFTDKELDEFLETVPFMGNTTDYVAKFIAGVHERQGEIGDIFVNIDEIKSQHELEEYMMATRDPQFNVLKKRLSFMGSDIKLEKGQKVEIESRIDKIESPDTPWLLPDKLVEPYESSIAVPGRDKFFHDFQVFDRYGEELNKLSEGLEFRTINPDGTKSDPEIIIFPDGVKIIAKKDVELEDYVFYGKDIRFY